MRKITLIFTVLLGISAMAQEGPLISSAVLADRNNELAQAKEYIDQADDIIKGKSEEDVSYKNMRKFLYYKGLVYYKIATSNEPSIKALDANALDKATNAFQKTIEYEAKVGKESFTKDAQDKLPYISAEYAQRGINKANEQDFEAAYSDFMTSYKLKKNEMDTSMYFNAGLMAQNAKKYDEAIKINRELIDMGYMGTTFTASNAETGETINYGSKKQMDQQVKLGLAKDPKVAGDIRSDMYASLANLYLAKGDTAMYKTTVSEGRTKFPENEALLRAELQGFLDAKQYDKALVNLDQAIAGAPTDPSSKLFYYIKGFILHTNVEDDTAALEAYTKAAALDPEYLDPRYMSGLIYVERGNELTNQMNNLPLNAKAKYEKLRKAQDEAFSQALPYFEAAYEINPEDKETLSALGEVYRKLKMVDKFKKIQAEQAALGQ